MIEVKRGHTINFKEKEYKGGDVLPPEFEKQLPFFKAKVVVKEDKQEPKKPATKAK